MNRGRALRQKVNSSFGSLYAEVEFDDALHVRRVAISHPSKHRDTHVGDALQSLADAFNDLIADLQFSRAARSTAEVAASPSAAASVLPVVNSPSASSPGASFSFPQGEPDFEGGGE